jgi:hypothetical protein
MDRCAVLDCQISNRRTGSQGKVEQGRQHAGNKAEQEPTAAHRTSFGIGRFVVAEVTGARTEHDAEQ